MIPHKTSLSFIIIKHSCIYDHPRFIFFKVFSMYLYYILVHKNNSYIMQEKYLIEKKKNYKENGEIITISTQVNIIILQQLKARANRQTIILQFVCSIFFYYY